MSASAAPAPCDCHEIRPPDLTPLTGLSLRGASSHLGRQLALLLVAQDLPLEERAGAWFISPAGFGRLEAVLAALSPTERPGVLAAPWTAAGELDPWGLAPLEVWVRRLGSAWFAAASTGGLHFHLQPVVALASGQVYGYEALVRAHGEGGLIGAGPLLEAAAAHGQARAFDALARRGAIRQVYPRLQPGEVLFINFAPGVVYNPDICLRTTFETCQEVGADFSRLLFEVTESEAFPDLRLLRSILERYRAQGAQVALDDLGAGHTSLTYLSELRPDIVKLDRALVRGLHGADPRVPLITALVRYAHDLGIRVVSEGIETPGELELVRQLGSDYAQGYLLGRPAPQPLGVAEAAARLWPRQAPSP
ncbi:EAL domain-containing protein [Deinococcus budaensis]|uniref:EAL domain-containing protein (Putative c-di-GMP-specific phosphodiesterase class I) n=1 Tax=Deinococcus budaensis TaxID=1665626 RepID=A0A7W8LPQ5_9DEIO|nr:EAL domain-containing protein [Deinococcus budaensis]MBB5234018.1 EAL domain-containing protein (putative c-di-GMP-specific phosphodiesterase class I) [Deinococcus budaensis]